MNGSRLASIAERKALLATRAELDRTRVALAFHAVREIVVPSPSAESLARARPTAALLVGLVAPLVGMPRLARWLRIGSLGLAAYRVVRNWQSAR